MAPRSTEAQAPIAAPGTGDAQAIIAAVAARSGSEIVHVQGPHGEPVQVAKRPDGTVVSIRALVEEYRLTPQVNCGTAEMYDEKSFVAHVARFKNKDSTIFVDDKGDCTAVYDYSTREQPLYHRHRAKFEPGLHASFLAWDEASGEWLTQEQFAELIQARLDDVREPNKDLLSPTVSSPGGSAALRTLADGLEVNVGRKISNHVRLQSGESRVVFDEGHTGHTDGAGKPLSVPDGFLLGLPVFASQKEAFPLSARLRYRVTPQGIRWQVTLLDLDDVKEAALTEHCARIEKATGLLVLRGAP